MNTTKLQTDILMYKVVSNHEGQYSIWPNERANPGGWEEKGFVGSKEQCLTYIEKEWTDMRPLSLRRSQ